jgi:acylphosphatase
MAAIEPTCIRLRIEGRVQGVFFRASVERRAAELGLAGWVRNCADGSVELCAEGSQEACRALKAFCAEGPPAARVDSVRERPCSPSGGTGFEVRY